MKRTLLALALAASPIAAEESKPIATQAGEIIEPAAEAYGRAVNQVVNEFLAGTKGPLSKAARANLKRDADQEQQANRGVRRTMKECIKPGNVIDDDVKECIEGLRTKEW